MIFTFSTIRRIYINIAISILLLVFIYSNAIAYSQDATLLLRPHCKLNESGSGITVSEIQEKYGYVSLLNDECADFFVEDPQTLKTALLKINDEIDMDIVIQNPSLQPISHARVWLSYDPTVLYGINIETSPLFDTVTPGEADFDAENGYVMIEVSAEENPPNSEMITIARIKFIVTSQPPTGTPIGFYDPQENGHTAIYVTENSENIYILSQPPGSLHVAFDDSSNTNESSSGSSDLSSIQSSNDSINNIFDTSSENSSSSVSSIFSSENNSSYLSEISADNKNSTDGSQIEPQRTAFSLLQVRNLRATTEGSSLYIGWDALNHPSLKAYNIYYGTTSGRYIQRKTVAETMNSLIIRSLPIGTSYFVAVRAVADNDEESAFSYEVSVEIGDPSTASVPLIPGSTDIGPDGENPLIGTVVNPNNVPGETGTSSSLILFFFIAAIAGTVLAFRRQIMLSSPIYNDK